MSNQGCQAVPRYLNANLANTLQVMHFCFHGENPFFVPYLGRRTGQFGATILCWQFPQVSDNKCFIVVQIPPNSLTLV